VLRCVTSAALSLAGAVLGGVAGYYACAWIAGFGFLVLALPGALLGVGCGLFSRNDSLLRGFLCGLAGLALALAPKLLTGSDYRVRG